MSTLATISVYNNLATCETGITMRSANDELASGVYVVFDIKTEEVEYFLGVYLLFDARNEDVDDVIFDLFQHFPIFVELIMLGAYHNRVNTLWNAIVAVLYRHLTLGVWTEIGHDLAFLADIGQCTHD